MFEIVITGNTYDFLINDNCSVFLIELGKVEFQQRDTEYIMSFEPSSDSVDNIYTLIWFIYSNKSNENNRWVFNGKEYPIYNEKIIKLFLLNFEGTDDYPLRSYILSDVIKDAELSNIQQVRELAQKPFTGILPFDQLDTMRLLGNLPMEEIPDCIKIEHKNIYISNRHVKNSFEIKKGSAYFRNCILDGNILISSSPQVNFSQCIITGEVKCVDVSYVYLSSVNMKQFALYNSTLSHLRLEYSKIYRFVFHSCEVEQLTLYHNKFIEPYIANLHLSDVKEKIDTSQFVARNINNRTITRINKGKPVSINNEGNFYLTFLFREPAIPTLSKDIALDMVNIILTYGDLEKEHRLYSDMKYKKALYSNTGWKRAFAFLTGAFYIPSRWVVYLALNLALFTMLFIGVPTFQFINTITNSTERLDLWTAAYYSICQVIGSNPTHFSPIGATQVCTAIQSLLNTVFIANFFVALIKKFMRDEI